MATIVTASGRQHTTIYEGTVQIGQRSRVNPAPPISRLAISLAALLVFATGPLAVQPAHSQSADARQVSSLSAEAPYDDRTLQSFATAAAGVLALRGHYYPRIRAAEIAGSQEKADRLFTEMRERMNSAIRGAGFSEAQYRAISSAAKTDDNLRQRINAFLKGQPPAKQQIRNVARVTPKAPQPAAAPAAPATTPAAPAPAPTAPAPAAAAVPSADDSERQRLQRELAKANAERERHQAEQAALRDKTKELERELAAVKTEEAARRKRLNEQKAKALAEQRKAEAELDTLLGEVTTLKSELATVQSRDDALREQLEAQRIRADAAQINKEARLAAFRHQIKRLAERLATAQQSLDSMASDLQPDDAAAKRQAAPFEALQPLRKEPTSIERLLAKAGPQVALRQELDSEIAQNRKERQAREAERTALQREIAELSHDLSATYQAMADLIGEPASTAVAATELDIQDGIYALDVSQETAQLFEMGPAPFEPAPQDNQADILLDEPASLGIGDPIDEPSASAPGDGAALDADTTAPLRVNPAPAVQVATAAASQDEDEGKAAAAEVRPTHQIVRDEEAFKPAAPPADAPAEPAAAQPADFANTVSGGAAAYRAGDFDRAYEIWTALAEAGSRSAQFHLGALYFEGRGTEADLTQAHFWLQVSAYQGDTRAPTLLTTVAEKLTLAEINASQTQAREWLQERSIEVTQVEPDRSNAL